MPYDLANAEVIRTSIQTIRAEWCTLNVLVNNAAPMDLSAPTVQPFEDVPLTRWEAMLRSTLEGVTVTLQSAVLLMRESGWGRIVTISSDATDGWTGLGPYATAKVGLYGLSRTLAVELGPANILSKVLDVSDKTSSLLTASRMPTRRARLAPFLRRTVKCGFGSSSTSDSSTRCTSAAMSAAFSASCPGCSSSARRSLRALRNALMAPMRANAPVYPGPALQECFGPLNVPA